MKNNSIKRRLMLFVCALSIAGITNAQTITGYRYWFDNNINAATAVSTTATANLNLTAALSTTSLGLGYHSITLQFQDANGAYSSPQTSTFVKTGSNISAYDYWWDANYSNHTMVNVTPAQTIDLSAVITPYNIDTGMHLFAIRFKDLQGNWSVPVQDTVHTTVFISGIHEIASVNNINIFPNPAHAGTVLTFNGSGNEILTMTLLDLSGNVIRKQDLQNGYALQQYPISTSNLAAGIYLVKITSGKQSITRKLVVQ